MATDRIEREIVIGAPPQRVWQVLTEAVHISGWFGDATEIDLRSGGAIVFAWNKYGSHHGVVEQVEPPRFFSYRWARPASMSRLAEGSSTLVEFTLSPDGAGTRLRVVETGFASLAVTEEERGSRSRRTSRAGSPNWANSGVCGTADRVTLRLYRASRGAGRDGRSDQALGLGGTGHGGRGHGHHTGRTGCRSPGRRWSSTWRC